MGEKTRDIKRRMVIEAVLELTSPTHFGGIDPYDILEMPIARDTITGKPIIYGTTLAGLLRGALSNRIAGSLSKEPSEVFTLFGGSENDNVGEQSHFIVDDAVCEENVLTDIRDGVAIKPESGVAEKGAKFDIELLPSGTRFPIHLELALSGKNDTELKKCLTTCMDALEKGDVLLGARNRKGFGRCTIAKTYPDECRWKVWDIDMTTRDGLLQWVFFGHKNQFPKECPQNEHGYFHTAKGFGNKYGINDIYDDAHPEFTFDVTLKINSSMLIRSVGYSADDADATHLSAIDVNGNKTPIVSGTSLGGILRSRALKIANTLDKTANFVDDLFGTREVKKGKDKWAGRVYVEECEIKDRTPLRHTRIKIDRWTGGALEHCLFEADAQFGGTANLIFRLIPRKDVNFEAEIGMMLCVLKDLFTGDLPIGGESSIGRGRLIGKEATLTYRQNKNETINWKLTGNSNRTFTIEGDTRKLQEYVDEFLKEMRYNKEGQ